ncbi:cysteinyl leukotriene receptor 2-like [Myxocyprinus asiaticus]|uniref:cysteinyl leukotriene receptor 2-like n=1 Tax=Myxocyprinus asiaticus TaxID=70543 RepID=UPI0022217D46|nr:cysteinyl leukotriene receptor 2-like [Myxocyprinus asiaticus]XP_051533378.1 cysteinyl leukotriene receptor 2-like [Myxocyprinus asiaticus]XP_051533379.1 cysteinyl leukotriene receptor 2-like [Myxocyprinus asiaticus]
MNASSSELWNNISCGGSIDDFKHVVYPVAYLIIFVLGTAGHSLSICVFFSQWRVQKSFTPVNLLMVNLLVSDLMLVCSLPLRISYYLLNSHWPFGDIACRVILYVFYLNMYSSVYFLVALNVLRYLALVWPYLYLRIQTHCCAGIVCGLIWLLMALASSPLLFSKRGNRGEGSARCLELALESVEKLLFINNVSFPVGFFLPLVVIIFCSVFVVKSLLRPRPGLGRTRPCRKKACALVIISFGIFLLCFLPYHVVRTIFLYTEKQVKTNEYRGSCHYLCVVRKVAVISHCLCTANSCLDPVLFFFVGENFRTFSAKWMGGRRTSNSVARRRQQEELQVLQK